MENAVHRLDVDGQKVNFCLRYSQAGYESNCYLSPQAKGEHNILRAYRE